MALRSDRGIRLIDCGKSLREATTLGLKTKLGLGPNHQKLGTYIQIGCHKQ